MYIGLHVKYPLLFSFLDLSTKNNEISNFMKIFLVVTKLFHADG